MMLTLHMREHVYASFTISPRIFPCRMSHKPKLAMSSKERSPPPLLLSTYLLSSSLCPQPEKFSLVGGEHVWWFMYHKAAHDFGDSRMAQYLTGLLPWSIHERDWHLVQFLSAVKMKVLNFMNFSVFNLLSVFLTCPLGLWFLLPEVNSSNIYFSNIHMTLCFTDPYTEKVHYGFS